MLAERKSLDYLLKKDNAYTYNLEEDTSHAVISAGQLRGNLPDVLSAISKKQKRVVVTSHGSAKAVLISPEELVKFEKYIEQIEGGWFIFNKADLIESLQK